MWCRAPRPSEQARADFSPPTGGQEWFQMVMQSMLRQYHRDFVHRVRSDRFSPCVTAVPHRRRTSEHVQAFDHEGTLMSSRWVLHLAYIIIPLCKLLSVQVA